MDDTNDNPPHRGGCLCGAVRYEVAGPPRQVVSCHCSQCLRTHGHYAAYTAAARGDLSTAGDNGRGQEDATTVPRALASMRPSATDSILS